MRFIGSLSPTHGVTVPADTVANFLLASNAGQAMDYPTGADFVRIAAATTAGGQLGVVFNAASTGAVWGTSFSATTASSAQNALVPAGAYMFYQVPRLSTGFSLIAGASGYATVEFWGRHG